MDLFREPYLILFHAITDALAHMEQANYGLAASALIAAQQAAEDAYLEGTAEE